MLSAVASLAAAFALWTPAPGTTFQIQLQGEVDLSVEAQVYEVDGFETSAETVAALHERGRRAVCYVNAGAWEDWRPDADRFPREVLGKPLAGWPGERWLDVRRLDVLLPLVRERFRMCAEKGFDAVETDNVNGWENPTGFGITRADQLRYNRRLAAEAHALGLSIGLKNDFDQAAALVRAFDFSVAEECFQYRECEKLLPFVRARKAVFDIEYKLRPAQFCAKARKLRITAIRKKLDLGPYRVVCP